MDYNNGAVTSPVIRLSAGMLTLLPCISIPSHHPSIPGTMTSTAILSTIWEHVRRLTSDFLENDANTSETLSTLMSEAARDGCMPFGSHLHMEFGSPFLSSRKHMEGTW